MLIPEDVVCDIFQVPSDEAAVKRCKDQGGLIRNQCMENACSMWTDRLLNQYPGISFFTVIRPKKKLDRDKIIETDEYETIRFLRRPDLETLLVDKKSRKQEYQVDINRQ